MQWLSRLVWLVAAAFGLVSGIAARAVAADAPPQCRHHPLRRSGLDRLRLHGASARSRRRISTSWRRKACVFTRGYVPTSLCRPSLVTLITGLYPHQHLDHRQRSAQGHRSRARCSSTSAACPTLPQAAGARRATSAFRPASGGKGILRRAASRTGMTHGDPARGGRHGDEGLKIGREGLQPIFDFLDDQRRASRSSSGTRRCCRISRTIRRSGCWRSIATRPIRCTSPSTGRCASGSTKRAANCSAHLDKQGLAENTLVVYVTDNGWIQDPDSRQVRPAQQALALRRRHSHADHGPLAGAS